MQELEKELQKELGKFYFVKVDLCSEENILEAFKWVKSTLKKIDVLVNNAGVWKSTDLLGNNHNYFLIRLFIHLHLFTCTRLAYEKKVFHIIQN